MSILWNMQFHLADEKAEVQKSSTRAIEEPCYLREEWDCKPGCLIPNQGLWFPQLSSECSHSHVAVAQRYPSWGPPSCCLQMPCPSHHPPALVLPTSLPGPDSLWHFPYTQFSKLDHGFFIIYTNILNYFSSNLKYLFLIYGCKYKASRAHISQGAIPTASRAFQI